MAIQIWNGSSWVTSDDPEVFTGGTWTNVQKGEVYTSTGWQVFYLRVTPIAPTITLNSRTSTSITVNVFVPTGTPYKTQVTIWRVAGVETNIPATPAVGQISSMYTQSGLSANTSYTFSAYTRYYDATTNELVAQSSTTTFTTSTLAVVIQSPTLTLNTSGTTVSSITVNTTLPTGSPYKTQITVFRNDNPFDPGEIPGTPAVGAISGTFTQTSLSVNTSYNFSAYATYYDATTNDVVGVSATTTNTFSTLNYLLTVPTNVTNTFRATTSLTFEADSNANFTRNASTAYIEFELSRFLGGVWTVVPPNEGSSALPNNDTTATRNATFNSLVPGATYRARARTIYSTIGRSSGYSGYTANVTTRVTETTGYVPLNNSTYMNTSVSSASASSTAFGFLPSQASDGSTSTVWASDPLVSTTSTETRTINEVQRTSTHVTYYWTTNATLGTIEEADVDGITTLITTTLDRRRQNIDGGLRVRLRYSSGTNPPFYANDTVSVSGADVIGIDGTSKSVINRLLVDNRVTLEFVRTGATTDPSYVVDAITISGSATLGKNVSNLNTVGFKTVTASNKTSAQLAVGSVGATAEFTLANVNTGSSIILRGKARKGSGTETLTLNFCPKTSYENPRMIGGSDGIRITNDSVGTQTFSIARMRADGTFFTFATNVSLAANDTDTYHFTGTIEPVDVLGAKFFVFRITANRVNSGANGWYSSFKEVAIQYRYDS